MIPLEAVQAEIAAAVRVLEPVTVGVREARGLVLAAPLSTAEPVPPWSNTAMDGYAVRAADTAGASSSSPVRLTVVGELPAGRSPAGLVVGAGEAIRIMTGAPIPDGADAIVKVEDTDRAAPDGVFVHQPARTDDHVRPAGGDLAAGQVVFPAGTVLGPAHVGVLASVGVRSVSVHRRARVGVLSTGDELVETGRLPPGKIRDSNRPMLRALVAETGADPVDLGTARDDEDDIASVVEDATARCDVLVTSGGVSVGDYDYVKAVLDRMGSMRWCQVAIKPAKPLAYGTVLGIPAFGLPGNPVSSHVSYELFARPATLGMMGHAERSRPEVVAVAEHDLARRRDGKLHLDRARVRIGKDGRYTVARTGAQHSNVLSGMAAANSLVLVPDGDGIPAGGDVRVMLLRDP